MATTLMPSCRLISPVPSLSMASATASRRPPLTSTAFVPPGYRDERRRWPSLNLNQHQLHSQPPAIRPCVIARAHKCGGAPAPRQQRVKSADRDYFVEERKCVLDCYNDIIYIDHGCLYMEATKMSAQLCLSANDALTIACQIMSSASLQNHLGAPSPNEISADTVHVTLRAYVKIFVDAADAAYGRTVSKTTATSFLGALRGLVSVTHILLDAALENLSRTQPRESLEEYAFNCDVEQAMRAEFCRQMDAIEDGVSKASAAETWCKVVMPGILKATRITGSFVKLMVARRQRALGKANSKVVAV